MQTIQGALAFVPAPLPRGIPLSGPTLRLLTRAEHSLGHLNGATGKLVNPFLLGSPLLRREAILSSRIEGTITSPEELVLFEAGSPPTESRREADTREVANYIRAMTHGLARLQQLPVSLRLIRELHAELLRGVRGGTHMPGEFRDSQNFIARLGDPIEKARFVPPPVPEMKEALAALETYLHIEPQSAAAEGISHEVHRDLAPLLVRLALIHYQFEVIHPFRDGNGRVGRLLIPLLLISHGKLRQPVLYLSAYFERNRPQYYDRLLHVSHTGQWEQWLDFFLRGIDESSRESVEQVEGLLDLRERWHSQFHSARSSALLLKLIDALFQSPSITIGRAAKLLGVTEASASYNIKKLVDGGILQERTGRKWAQIFIAMDILRFMDDSAPGNRT
jgi:Fic family protein